MATHVCRMPDYWLENRMLLFSLSFNFGKMNQDKTAAVAKGMRQFGY